MPGRGGLRTPSNSRRIGDSQMGHAAASTCSRATGSVIFFQPSGSCVHYSTFFPVWHLARRGNGSMDNDKKGARLPDAVCPIANRPRGPEVQMNYRVGLRRLSVSRPLAGREPTFTRRWLSLNILNVPALEALLVRAVHVFGAVQVPAAPGTLLEVNHLTISVHAFPQPGGKISYIV